MPRVGKHFKAHTSLRNHRKSAGTVYAQKELLGTYVSLGMAAVENFADRTGDSFVVSKYELCSLCGVSRPARALERVRKLADADLLEVREESGAYRITMRNFAKKQGFRNRKNAVKTPNEENPSSSSSSSTSSKRERAPSAPREEPGDLEEPRQTKPLEARAANAVRLLSRHPESEVEKLAWVEANLPAIEDRAESDEEPFPSVLRRWWNQYRQRPQAEREFGRLEEIARKKDLLERGRREDAEKLAALGPQGELPPLKITHIGGD